jgi:uncharacterized protein YndB with AHSA1/START domain
MSTIKLEKNYPIAKEAVWEYLTTDELLTSWCMPSYNFSLEKGKEFRFEVTPSKFFDGIFINTIIDYDICSFLTYQCENKKSGLKTIVTWKLVEENRSTKLSLEHSGFRRFKELFTKIAITGGWKDMMNKKLYRKLVGKA